MIITANAPMGEAEKRETEIRNKNTGTRNPHSSGTSSRIHVLLDVLPNSPAAPSGFIYCIIFIIFVYNFVFVSPTSYKHLIKENERKLLSIYTNTGLSRTPHPPKKTKQKTPS
jgi:hypothetical protein